MILDVNCTLLHITLFFFGIWAFNNWKLTGIIWFFQVCCGAGTAADCDKVTEMIGSQLELLRLDWNRQVKVCTAMRLFKNMLFRWVVNDTRVGQFIKFTGKYYFRKLSHILIKKIWRFMTGQVFEVTRQEPVCTSFYSFIFLLQLVQGKALKPIFRNWLKDYLSLVLQWLFKL
jgi:hypothetical protein